METDVLARMNGSAASIGQGFHMTILPVVNSTTLFVICKNSDM